MDGFIGIDWTAQPLSIEQKLVLLKIAALYLESGSDKDWVDFTHLLIEGRLTHQSSGMFVTYAGNFFHADLGTIKGEKWTSDFLITNSSRRHLIENDPDICRFQQMPDGSFMYYQPDPALTHVTADSLIGS